MRFSVVYASFWTLIATQFLALPSSSASTVKGTIDPPVVPTQGPRALGHSRTLVASRASTAFRRSDIAVFLAAKESGVITPQKEPLVVSISNLRLEPSIAACVIDGKVEFKNGDRYALTVVVDDKDVGPIQPGQSMIYDCKTADPQMRKVRVKEWPHIHGSLFTGDIGVVASIGATGAFSLNVPQGKYELSVIRDDGEILKKPVEVKADVDLGKLALPNTVAQEQSVEVPEAQKLKTDAKTPAKPAKAPSRGTPGRETAKDPTQQ